jgi:two-component system, cell cycle response regulator
MSEHEVRAMHVPDVASSQPERPRVLVAEDDDATRRILFYVLQQWGYDIILSKNGSEAWEILQQEHPPELIILDWEMPGMDGIELCRKLRDKSRTYYHYVLMITGRSDKQDIVHARELGADDCLAKPFDQSDLKARLGVGHRIVALQNELIKSRDEHREQAMKDGMTGLWNRAAFLELIQHELERAARSNGSTGLLLLDLDHFKNVNDTYGHLVGDIVLKETARRLKQTVRSYDFVGRYGGEEFFIALPGCNGRQLRKRAEAIRLAVAREPVRIGRTAIPITVSIGAVVASAKLRTMSDILSAADAALYKAKDSGRNCTVLCEKPLNETADSATLLAWPGWRSDIHDTLTLPDGRRLGI